MTSNIARNAERDASICAYYSEGHKMSECAARFNLGRQRVQQILRKADLWKPYVKSDRTAYIGVHVSEDVKQTLTSEARRRDVSISKLAASILNERSRTMQKASELLTDEFIERMLEDIPRALPAYDQAMMQGAARHSHRDSYRRMMRQMLLERLRPLTEDGSA